MKQYLELLELVLAKGCAKPDRTGEGTLSYFGTQTRYDLKEGFPLLTTKKIHFRSVVYELLWFLKGDTNIKYLVDHKVRIWNEWPYAKYQLSPSYQKETLQEFVAKIRNDAEFAAQWGNLGPVYGHQWRNFFGIDQIKNLVTNIKKDPYSRRHIISAWNPPQIQEMLLPPCHTFVQFYVDQKKRLSCQLYQRSADIFLGVPFNIASYALLTHMIAQVTGLSVGEFIHTLGDAHIYNNHQKQVQEQLTRQPKKLAQLILNPKIKDIFSFKYEDITLENYDPWPAIKAKVAV